MLIGRVKSAVLREVLLTGKSGELTEVELKPILEAIDGLIAADAESDIVFLGAKRECLTKQVEQGGEVSGAVEFSMPLIVKKLSLNFKLWRSTKRVEDLELKRNDLR